MVLIAGLGNPGKKHQNTRHNVGFMAIDAVLKKLGKVDESVWQREERFNSEVARIDWGENPVNIATNIYGIKGDKGYKEEGRKNHNNTTILLVKPQTFMNASGLAVAKVLNFYKINPLGLYVIHDEIDLPLGKVKVVVNRGAAGHHGVESIIKETGTTNFVRIRIGVGGEGRVERVRREEGLIGKMWGMWERRVRRGGKTENFVLEPFYQNEEGKLNEAIKKTVDIMDTMLKDGVERAMTKFN